MFDEVVVSLARLNHIKNIDVDSGEIVVIV